MNKYLISIRNYRDISSDKLKQAKLKKSCNYKYLEMQQPSACGERLFLSQEWSDFSLTVRDRRPWRFPVHTVVLAAQSDVFRSMFEREFSERETRNAFISDIKPRVMELLLGYFYKGTANLSSWWDVRELLQAAHKYQVDPLVQHCARFLETALTLSNVCSIYNDAVLYSLATLREECLHLIHHGGFLVLRSKSFEILTKEALVDVIANPFLNVKEELKVFEALLRWAKMQCCRLGLPVTEVNIFREMKPFLKFLCLNDMSDEEKSSLPPASLLLMQPTKRCSLNPDVLLSHCSSSTLREDPNSTLEISPGVPGNTLVGFSPSAPAHLLSTDQWHGILPTAVGVSEDLVKDNLPPPKKMPQPMKSPEETLHLECLSISEYSDTKIVELVKKGEIEEAFDMAMETGDEKRITLLCESVNPEIIFRRSGCLRNNQKLLSLMQYLSCNLSEKTFIKIPYFEYIITTLNIGTLPKDEANEILRNAQSAFIDFIANNPTHQYVRFKIIELAILGLLSSVNAENI